MFFTMKHSVIAVVGQLPNAPISDWIVDRACEIGNEYTLPDSLRFKLMIHKFCDRVTRTMYSNSHDPLGLQPPGDLAALMSAWETGLGSLELEFCQQWSSEPSSSSSIFPPS